MYNNENNLHFFKRVSLRRWMTETRHVTLSKLLSTNAKYKLPIYKLKLTMISFETTLKFTLIIASTYSFYSKKVHYALPFYLHISH
jgi:hypothetical protein